MRVSAARRRIRSLDRPPLRTATGAASNRDGERSGSLPLFPDLLDRFDPFGRQADHLQTGHGVWSIGRYLSRRASEDASETCLLVVVYDDQRFRFEADKDGKRWTVEIRHYHNVFDAVPSGWGAGRRVSRKMRQHCRFVKKHFRSRGAAADFAERLIAVFDRVREARESE